MNTIIAPNVVTDGGNFLDLIRTLSETQQAVVAAFAQGVKVQESIAAAEDPAEDSEAKE